MSEQEDISITKEVERMWAAKPFKPFVIVMTSGQRYSIGPSDTVAMGESVITIILPGKGEYLLRQNQISEIGIPEEAQ